MSFGIVKKEREIGEVFDKILKEFQGGQPKVFFIKPNLGGRSPIIEGENTDPRFLEKLICSIKKINPERIIIGHGSLLGTPEIKTSFDEIIEKGGYSFLSKIPKVSIVNLDKVPQKNVTYKNVNFSIPMLLDKADIY